jgi:nitroreductase
MTATLDSSTSPSLPLLVHLISRRVPPAADGEPPSAEQLAWLVRSGTSVPDHGALQPWRFVVISGDDRHQLGDALAADFVEARGEASPTVLDRLRRKAFAAPTIIVIVASPNVSSKVPEWEQTASAACCGYAIVLAAHALELGAVWKSTPIRDGHDIRSLCHLAPTEQLLGWINVGSTDDPGGTDLRAVPDLSSTVSVLTAGGPHPYEPPS